MSLLLEALKKAEKAKEDAQRRARDGGGGGELRLADDSTAPASAKPVTTRAELPDISAPLEILSEDFASKPGLAESAPEPQAAARAPAPGPAAARRAAPEPQAAARATARKVFEAKVREPNPRLPFYITVGTLGAFAVGTIVYFWIQLRPPAPLVNANPVRSTTENPVAVAPAPASSAPVAVQSQTSIPGLPAASPSAPAAKPAPAAAIPKAVPPRPATPAIPRDAPAQRVAPVARAAPAMEREQAGTPLVSNRPPPQVHPRVASAYVAYQSGNLMAARNDYEQALRDEPGNRDALLGLAAVETRSERYDLADAIYGKLLQADPRDPHAQAGFLALRGQGTDPQATESRLKSLIAADPEAGVLQFALGNVYARQGRWAEAQQAFFTAVATDPDNPDYAYNLAVSLEHLRQYGPALDHYRRALNLAQKRNASFDLAAARGRVQNLTR